jgi:hypothetical protein
MLRHNARANATKSALRAAVEHVFAHQKTWFRLFIHAIGLLCAKAKPTLDNKDVTSCPAWRGTSCVRCYPLRYPGRVFWPQT